MNIALVLLWLFLKAKLGIDSRLIFAVFFSSLHTGKLSRIRRNESIYKLVPGEEWLREQGRSHSGVGSRGLKGSIGQPESFIRCDFLCGRVASSVSCL